MKWYHPQGLQKHPNWCLPKFQCNLLNFLMKFERNSAQHQTFTWPSTNWVTVSLTSECRVPASATFGTLRLFEQTNQLARFSRWPTAVTSAIASVSWRTIREKSCNIAGKKSCSPKSSSHRDLANMQGSDYRHFPAINVEQCCQIALQMWILSTPFFKMAEHF